MSLPATFAARLCAAITLASTLARAEQAYPACGHEPTETDVGAAKGAFQAGNASFDEADYPRAIVYWEDAYRRDCTAHALLLNLARAYELNADRRQAIVALESYLERVPNSADRDKIERRIEVLRKQIEAEAAAPAPAPAQTAAREPEKAAVPAATPTTTSAPVVAEPSHRGGMPIAPLIVVGAGGALAIFGGILYGIAWGDLKAAEDRCPGRRCPTDAEERDANSAKRRVNTSGVITLSGLAIAGGGLAWFFIARQQSAAPVAGGSLITPVAGRGFAGVSYSGAF